MRLLCCLLISSVSLTLSFVQNHGYRTLLLKTKHRKSAVGSTIESTLVHAGIPTESGFDWERQWYPVVPVRDLHTDRPNKATLLGRDFCIWQSDGNWLALADSCPHRLIPLSEGRIENNKLQCAYHGWEFNDSGSCVKIPQLGTESRSSPALLNQRACASTFPLRVIQDLVWIFPSNDAVAAQLIQPALIDELDDSRNVDATDMYTRDLPYSWDVLVENLCDPTHVSFAHHSFMNGADRYADNQELNLRIINETSTGFHADKEPPPENGKYHVKFVAPCLLYYSISSGPSTGKQGDTFIGIGSYCVPTAPGQCRLIARFPFRIPVAPAMLSLRYTPTWINHYSQNVVLDSDAVFLSTQDERLQNRDTALLGDYYMPSRADTLVRAFRRWLTSAGQPVWQGVPAARSTGNSDSWIRVPNFSGRDSILDRFRQHTQICSSCRKAHGRLHLAKICSSTLGITFLCLSSITRNKIAAATALLCFLIPRFILQPLISRLEMVPWPRARWLKSSKRYQSTTGIRV